MHFNQMFVFQDIVWCCQVCYQFDGETPPLKVSFATKKPSMMSSTTSSKLKRLIPKHNAMLPPRKEKLCKHFMDWMTNRRLEVVNCNRGYRALRAPVYPNPYSDPYLGTYSDPYLGTYPIKYSDTDTGTGLDTWGLNSHFLEESLPMPAVSCSTDLAGTFR